MSLCRLALGSGLLMLCSGCPASCFDDVAGSSSSSNAIAGSALSRVRRPETRRETVVDRLHGVNVPDPYRWLEDPKDPGVAAWMRDQNTHARAELDALPQREALRARMRSLLYVDAISPPIKRGDRLFYSRRHADREKSVQYTRVGHDGPERVLLDPNTMSEDGSVSLRGVFPSWDGELVAYRLSRNAADAATLYVRDVTTGKDRTDTIEGARYAYPQWTPDGDGFYYVGLPTDPTIPPSELPGYAEVRYHRLGTEATQDELVYPALRDPQTFLGAQLSRDGRFLIVSIARGFDSTDIYFKDLTRGGDWQPLTEGTPYRSGVHVHEGTFYVLSNDGAPRFRVFAVDPARPQRDAWRVIVPQTDATLEELRIVGGKLALAYLHDVSSRLELRELDGSRPRTIELPGIGTSSNLIGLPDDSEAYYSFSSFTVTPRIYRLSLDTERSELWSEIEIPVDTSSFRTRQVWYQSADGTRVPMFIVHRNDIELDGTNPTLLYGYGGFSVSLTPHYSSAAVTWLEHGGVWAVANLRGGGELGESWHEAGKGPNKQNVFDDFIAAAEYLIAQGYTRPDKLAIRGGSNGGLLVGAAMTQRPDLFGAVVCQVPLLDMIRYHLFGSGKTWISEYGSADDPEQFKTLWGYSPYHKVRDGVRYPALLMSSADSDDRVDPMHARKFVAAVQAVTPETTPVLLRIEQNAGHGGADLIRQSVESETDIAAFLLAVLGETRARG